MTKTKILYNEYQKPKIPNKTQKATCNNIKKSLSFNQLSGIIPSTYKNKQKRKKTKYVTIVYIFKIKIFFLLFFQKSATRKANFFKKLTKRIINVRKLFIVSVLIKNFTTFFKKFQITNKNLKILVDFNHLINLGRSSNKI